MLFGKYRYIVVEGPIGTGKTALARQLAERFQANLLLENAKANPFLPKFYQDMPRHALSTQLSFLFQRINQVRDLGQTDSVNRTTIADFFLDKDPLFARLNLSDEEFDLYQQVYRHLQPQAPIPDLVIYLQAPPEVLYARVRRRGISYEAAMSEAYLARLASSYSDFFYHYDHAPLLIVNNERLNIVEREKDFELLIARIRDMRGKREFFNMG